MPCKGSFKISSLAASASHFIPGSSYPGFRDLLQTLGETAVDGESFVTKGWTVSHKVKGKGTERKKENCDPGRIA